MSKQIRTAGVDVGDDVGLASRAVAAKTLQRGSTYCDAAASLRKVRIGLEFCGKQ